MSRILFLDIDGVLNSHNFFHEMERKKQQYTNEMLDTVAVEVLNSIQTVTQCNIVISSSWRLCNSQEEIQKTLCHYGFKGNILDMTPDISLFDRKAEISNWIKNHSEADSFCALDDYPIKLPFWIEVDPKVGLTDEYYVDLVLNCFQQQEKR
mgnify:FL=1